MAKARKKPTDVGDLVTGKRVSTPSVAPDAPPDEKVAVVLELLHELDSLGLCVVLRHTEQMLQPRVRSSIVSEPTWHKHVEELLAERAKSAGVDAVVFDRGGTLLMRCGASVLVNLVLLQILLGAQIIWTHRAAAMTTAS